MVRRVVVIVALLLSVTAAQADSLWTQDSKSLFLDRRARAVGDILSVAIVEAVSASHAATSKTAKSSDVTAVRGTGLLSFFPPAGMSASRSSEGTGNTDTQTRITDHLSVTVTAVDKNGNLTVCGKRMLELGADKLEIQFSGKVRPDDISADNVVLSSNVADLAVTWSGKGPITQDQKPGLVYRLLHWLW